MATCKIFKSQLPETNSIFVNYGVRCKLHFWVAYNFIYPVPEQIYLYYPARMADSIQLSSWILYPMHSYTIEGGSLIQFYRPNPVTLLKMQLGPSDTPVIVCSIPAGGTKLHFLQCSQLGLLNCIMLYKL